MTTETDTEQKIQDKGLNAPRLTPDDITAVIHEIKYHHFEDTTTTVCCIVLVNGNTVIGESACISPENFDAEIGKEIAYNDARRQIWKLEGYLMKQRIWHDEQLKLHNEVDPGIGGLGDES